MMRKVNVTVVTIPASSDSPEGHGKGGSACPAPISRYVE